MAAFGHARMPARVVNVTSAAGTFPSAAGNYVSPDGAITVPFGALDTWFNYDKTASATSRGEVVCYGDSTMFGSGPVPTYSWLERMRDRAVAAGFADGGKGIVGGLGESGMGYDAPEVNAQVSTTFTSSGDFADLLMGGMWFDDGSVVNHVLNLQFRGSSARLWYTQRFAAGSDTYSLDGAAPVTINAFRSGGVFNQFVYFSGLDPAVTHTLQVVNITAGAQCRIALAPMFTNGVVFQKYAISGDTFMNRFYSGSAPAPYTGPQDGTWFQVPLGLAPTTVTGPLYAGAPVDTTIGTTAGQVKPVLALTQLGFNDLTNSVSGDEAYWTEYVRRFAGACRSAGVSGIVAAGQLPYNANWPTFGASRFNTLKTEALAQKLAFVDLFYPIGGPSLSYAGGTSNPHLTKTQYQTQADYLWDNLLGVV